MSIPINFHGKAPLTERELFPHVHPKITAKDSRTAAMNRESIFVYRFVVRKNSERFLLIDIRGANTIETIV